MIDLSPLSPWLANEWVQKIIWILITLIAAKIAVKVLSPVVRKFDEMVESVEWSEQTHKLIERIIKYGTWVVALLVILEILGLSGTITTALAGLGIMGLAIGFAAKDTLSNMISGFFLYLDRPFKIGETIEINGKVGKVMDIQLRKTVIKGFDNKLIIIPNSETADSMIINYSRMPNRRIDLPIGIAYESDLKKATKLILEVIKKDDDYLKDPEPSVSVDEFADFSVNLTVRVWIENKDYLKKKTKLLTKIKETFDKNGIEIPYPKRVMIKGK
jgi:small conductance mechanosensitive channel